MSRQAFSKQAGFTLIELLVVVLVLGIVASIALVALMNALDKSRQRGTMADMRTVGRTIEAYMIDNGQPPSDGGGLAALAPLLVPYQSNVFPTEDHWRNPYSYSADITGITYTLESHGKDGIDGADISYATRFDYDLDIVLSDGLFIAAPE